MKSFNVVCCVAILAGLANLSFALVNHDYTEVCGWLSSIFFAASILIKEFLNE